MFLSFGWYSSVHWYLFFRPPPKCSTINISSCFQIFLIASMASNSNYRLMTHRSLFSAMTLSATVCSVSPPVICPCGTLKLRCLKHNSLYPPNLCLLRISMNDTVNSIHQYRNLRHILSCCFPQHCGNVMEKKRGEIEMGSLTVKSFSKIYCKREEGRCWVVREVGRGQFSKGHVRNLD